MLISISVLISKQLHSRFMTLFSLLAFVFMESNMSENENSKLPEVAIIQTQKLNVLMRFDYRCF